MLLSFSLPKLGREFLRRKLVLLYGVVLIRSYRSEVSTCFQTSAARNPVRETAPSVRFERALVDDHEQHLPTPSPWAWTKQEWRETWTHTSAHQ